MDNKQFYWPPFCREQCGLLQELRVWSWVWAQILSQVLTSCMILDLLFTFSVLFSLFLGCAVFYQILPVVLSPCPIFLKPATTSFYYGTFQFRCLWLTYGLFPLTLCRMDCIGCTSSNGLVPLGRSQLLSNLVVRSYEAMWQLLKWMCNGSLFPDSGQDVPFDIRFLSYKVFWLPGGGSLFFWESGTKPLILQLFVQFYIRYRHHVSTFTGPLCRVLRLPILKSPLSPTLLRGRKREGKCCVRFRGKILN